jgi:hypothetical protein
MRAEALEGAITFRPFPRGIAPARLVCGVGVVTVAFALVGDASAAREPTRAEREAITAALPQYNRTVPAGCEYLDIKVSSLAKGWAVVVPVWFVHIKPCLRYAADGYYILRLTGHWRIAFNGSDPPPCSLHAPRDLIKFNPPCLG